MLISRRQAGIIPAGLRRRQELTRAPDPPIRSNLWRRGAPLASYLHSKCQSERRVACKNARRPRVISARCCTSANKRAEPDYSPGRPFSASQLINMESGCFLSALVPAEGQLVEQRRRCGRT